MRILFLHDNFPAQFGALGTYLARQGWETWFGTQREGAIAPGVKVFNYKPHRSVTDNIHPYAVNFERALLNGQAMAREGLALKRKGFSPDIVMAHSGWGPGLFVKDVWPDAKYVGYFEWYYRREAPDVAHFASPQEQQPTDSQLRARARNGAILMDLAACDAALCPTAFQKEQFPDCFSDKLSVLHDGIDTEYYAPDKRNESDLPDIGAAYDDEIITYVARGMEPYRGFPEFMKALEIVLRERPQARAVIVGEDRVAYGGQLEKGDSYKKRALESCDLDWDRVRFTGLLPRAQYRQILLASSVHVYLTVPFVLSWSMLEAMSAGCAIVASDVAPVREIFDKDNGALSLTSFDPEQIASNVIDALASDERRRGQGAAARALIERNYSAQTIYPEKRRFLENLF